MDSNNFVSREHFEAMQTQLKNEMAARLQSKATHFRKKREKQVKRHREELNNLKRQIKELKNPGPGETEGQYFY
jgi:polyhydroxyalkanoate synthesis regulator phasin